MIEITDHHDYCICLHRRFLLPNNMTCTIECDNQELYEANKKILAIILSRLGFTYSLSDDSVAWNQPRKILEPLEIRKIKDDNALTWSSIQHNQLSEEQIQD